MKKALFFAIFFITISCNDSKTFSLSDIAKGKLTTNISNVSLTGLTVSKLIDKFHEVASQLMFEGENRGNALAQILGNQLDISIQNANIAFKEQQNILFENLDQIEKSFFVQLNGIIDESKTSIGRAISILEITNLNLYELTNRLPFTKKNYNYINKIQGLVQIHQSGNYKIRVSGLGFGQDLDYIKYTPQVTIGGKEVNANLLSRMPQFDMDITLPHELLEPYFKNDSLQSLPLQIKMVAKVVEKCGLVFNCENEVVTNWNMKIILMPIYAGYITGVENLENEVLDGKTEQVSVTINTPDGSQAWDRTLEVTEKQRIIGVRYNCVSGMCGWSYNLRKGGYDPDYEIVNEGKKANVYRLTQGPATIIYYADYQTLIPVAKPKKIDTIKLEFGKKFTIPLSKENTSCRYKLEGKLYTGQDIFISSGMTESPDQLISLISFEKSTSSTACEPTYILRVP